VKSQDNKNKVIDPDEEIDETAAMDYNFAVKEVIVNMLNGTYGELLHVAMALSWHFATIYSSDPNNAHQQMKQSLEHEWEMKNSQ